MGAFLTSELILAMALGHSHYLETEILFWLSTRAISSNHRGILVQRELVSLQFHLFMTALNDTLVVEATSRTLSKHTHFEFRKENTPLSVFYALKCSNRPLDDISLK